MYRYCVDLSRATSMDEVHDILVHSLELPDYYGRNANALWDCLTGGIGLPATIQLRGRGRLLALDAFNGRLLCEVLDEAAAADVGIEVVWLDTPAS